MSISFNVKAEIPNSIKDMPVRHLPSSLLIAFLFTSGCAATQPITPNRAVEIATRECRTPQVVLVSEPRNTRTSLLSLEEADRVMAGVSAGRGFAMDTKVWLVQMDGELQVSGGPRPPNTPFGQVATLTPPPVFSGTCSVVILATTGEVLSRQDK